MKKRTLIVIIIVICSITFLLITHNTKKKNKIETITAKRGSISRIAQAIGYIEPEQSIIVKSAVNGSVKKIYHFDGDYVKKGETLAIIKPEPAPENYAIAHESLLSAIANKREAYKTLKRLRTELKLGLITKNYIDYINAKNSYKTTIAEYNLAKEKLDLLTKGSTQVGKNIISNSVKSPINGIILSRNINVGDPVISLSSAQNATPLFVMANMKKMVFRGSISELDAAKIKQGAKAIITIASNPNIKVTGVVSKISLQSDQSNANDGFDNVSSNLPFNVSFNVTITNLKFSKNIILRSGYSATANINIGTKNNIIILPERVIHFEKHKTYVFVLGKNNNKILKKYISIGISDGLNIEITNGLKTGCKVVDK